MSKRRQREAAAARARDPRPVCALRYGTGDPCDRKSNRRCGTCGRIACGIHCRQPWGGPWLCSECEAANGAPPKPAEFPDRHVPGAHRRAHPDWKVPAVEVIERRRVRDPE